MKQFTENYIYMVFGICQRKHHSLQDICRFLLLDIQNEDLRRLFTSCYSLDFNSSHTSR